MLSFDHLVEFPEGFDLFILQSQEIKPYMPQVIINEQQHIRGSLDNRLHLYGTSQIGMNQIEWIRTIGCLWCGKGSSVLFPFQAPFTRLLFSMWGLNPDSLHGIFDLSDRIPI
jgi:hypothetical protein